MTKKQKIWLGIFLAMFVIPELLWSPVGNFVYSWIRPLRDGSIQILRNNFLMDTSNVNIYSFILLVQLLGSILALIYLLVIHKYTDNKILFWVSTVFLFLMSLILFFIFGLSVSFRSFGF